MQSFKKHKIELVDLSSGAKLLNIIVPDLPLSIVSAWYRAGSRFDPQDKEGLAHFFEHLLMTKTKKYPNSHDRLQVLESKGIFFNAFTDREAAYYYQVQPYNKIYDSLSFLIDSLNNSVISQEDIDHEKKIILDEKSRVYNNNNEFIWHLNTQSLFKLSSLGRDFFGTKDSIQSTTLSDIMNFKDKYYKNNNLLFVVISNEQTDKINFFINNNFNSSGTNTGHKKEILVEDFKKLEHVNIDKRDNKNIFLGINYRLPSLDLQEEIILNFVTHYLSNSWISRLTEVLRINNNLTYWVDGVKGYFGDSGYLSFVFSVAKDKLNKSLDLIEQEINYIKNKEINNDSLVNHKESFKAYLLRKLIDPYELLLWYGYPALLEKEIVTPQDYVKQIEKITASSIKQVVNKYLNKENLTLTFIGDITENDVKKFNIKLKI
ncbi:insulinase family protein [bacterium]|jgi:predicted Zn-dependent peptidase|nr:insulinase family protein [bacterium]